MNNQDLYKVVAFQVAQTKNGKEKSPLYKNSPQVMLEIY